MGDTVFRLRDLMHPSRPAQTRRPALNAGWLHEVHALPDDAAAALAFALGAARSEMRALFLIRGRPRRRGRLPDMQPYGPGMAQLGIDPARLVVVDAGEELDLLRAGLDAARCGEAGTVILDAPDRLPRYDLTASRRLALAAERSGTRIIVLRGDAAPRPSAAQTRWRIAAAPSLPLAAGASGLPAIEAELLRWRGGTAGRRWRLEWDEDDGTFREAGASDGTAPLPRAVVPLFRLRASG